MYTGIMGGMYILVSISVSLVFASRPDSSTESFNLI